MFIFASDLHLSLITWRSLPEVREDSLLSFKQLLEECQRRSKDTVCPLVLGGDIFDSVKMTPELLTATMAIRNQYADIPIYYINGNHDLVEPSWCSFLGNTIHLGSQPSTLPGGEVVCGIDFKLAEEFPEAVKKVYPGCDHLIIHQTLDVLSDYLPGSIDSTPLNNFNSVIAGDYHKFMVAGPFASSGSTNRRSIAEDEGSAFVVRDNMTFEVMNMYNRPLLKVFTDSDAEIAVRKLYNMTEPFRDKLEYSSLLKGIIVVRGEITPDVKDYWTDTVNDRAYLMFVPLVKESEEITIDGSAVAAARSSRAYLLEMLEQYPCSSEAKMMIQDYLAHPDKLLETVQEKLK